MPSFISAAVAALSLSSLASANVAYRRAEAFTNSSSSSTQLSTSSSSRSVPIGTGITTSSPSSTVGAGASQGSSANGTATSTGSSPSATSTSYDTTFNGVSFFVEVDVSYTGVEIDLAIVFAKRAGQTLDDCLSTCSANTQCAATAFNSNSSSCTFYSSFDKNTRETTPGVTFAQVTGRPNSSSSAPANNGTSSTRAPFPSTTQSNNGTSVTASPNPGSNGTFPNVESIICPEYNDQVLQETDGSQYLIRCGTNIQGVVLLTRKARMVRRQATFGNDWIVDCIDTCSATAACVGTSYNSQQGTCTFYSTVDALVADANTDSAILVNEAPAPGVSSSASLVPVVSTQTVTEGDVTRTITTTPLTTSTVYSTTTKTIQSCAPGVPCTAATVTEVVVAYTTVCPVSAYPTGANAGAVGGANGGAATQTLTVCTACQYAPTTVTVYQCPTGANGAPVAGKPTPVTTTVIQVPVLAGPTGALTTSTVYQTQEHVTTTCGANGCGKATVTAVVSLYTTVCPASSGAASTPGSQAPGSQAPAPSAGSETVVVPGTTVPASTKPAETIPATIENGSTKPAETVPATVVPGSTKKPSTTIVQYTPTSSMVAYTGAAVKNGMGFAAMAAGVAALVL